MNDQKRSLFFSLETYKKESYFLVIGVYLLMVLGGYVKSIGAGLACPDWPLCHGQLIPEREFWFIGSEHNLSTFNWGLWSEFTHRLVALIVILIILHLFIIALKNKEEFPEIKIIIYLFVVLVVLQSIFGGLTVIYKLHPLIVTGHLGLGIFTYTITLINAFIIHNKLKT
ncbi:MAG: hypothetical protein D6732_22900 [Methanobacteriota archaeon]|nr:MAG: hypothetical protein D6732_22900 [Euryarchaeota archaeon]